MAVGPLLTSYSKVSDIHGTSEDRQTTAEAVHSDAFSRHTQHQVDSVLLGFRTMP